jgi:hypothetical protein
MLHFGGPKRQNKLVIAKISYQISWPMSWRKGHGCSRYNWREGGDGGDGDGDGARDMAACATTAERGIMVAMGHGFCVCFCVSGETTKIRKRAKL